MTNKTKEILVKIDTLNSFELNQFVVTEVLKKSNTLETQIILDMCKDRLEQLESESNLDWELEESDLDIADAISFHY